MSGESETVMAGNPAKIIFGRYILGRLLGQGTFAKVYLAKDILAASDVAIKISSKDRVLRDGGGSTVEERIMREISVMRLVRHPHVVDLREVMATKTRIFFVMEYVKGGELFEKVAKGRLGEGAARRYFNQLISAVDFFHSRGVSHRDLKPENLLLDADGDLKVSDFGLSALPEQRRQDGLLHTQCGTPNYVAPEVLRNRGYDGAKSDLWSCGVILYVLLAGFLPFKDKDIMHVYRKIFKAEYKIPPWFSPGAHHLISRLLVTEPEKRISVSEILDDPWFNINTDVYVHPKSIITSVLPPQLAIETKDRRTEPPPFYNAFELISTLSSGFNLSGMFESVKKADTVFTSKRGGEEIMERLEKVGEELGFEVSRLKEYKVKMERKRGVRIQGLIVMAEVFEIASNVEVVEFCRFEGDIIEYEKFWVEGIHPKMMDVVWTWHS